MAKTGPVTTWGGNDYYGHGEKVPYVYNASSSKGHVVKPNPANSGSSGGGSKSSGGSKKSSSKKASGVAAAPAAKAQKATGGYSGGGGGASEESSYDAEQARAEYLKKLQKLAKKVYNQNMAGINSSYTSAGNTLKGNYDSTANELASKYGYQKGNINTDAEESMRQAYINSMLQKKDLGQRMAAQGLSGGATETTMASLNNNYSNARNNIDTTRQRSLSDLEQTYNSNLAEAQRQYNSAVQNLAMQRAEAEQAARNAYLNLAANYQFNPGSISMPTTDYSSAMKSQSNFSFTPTEANNNVTGTATLQGDPDAVNSAQNNYALYLARQRAAGMSDTDLKNSAYSALSNGQISSNDLLSILNQLNIAV